MTSSKIKIIYFYPNPFTKWCIPWAFIVNDELGKQVLPSGLTFSKETCGSEKAALLANYCWESFKNDGNMESLGPHFSDGPLTIAPNDWKRWVKRLVNHENDND